MTVETSPPGLHVAIIGSGITGLILALGLSARGVSHTLYERGLAFTEIGAGIGFSPNAERALAVIDREVYTTYKRVASTTGDKEDYFQWVDGHGTNKVVARLLIGVDAFQGGKRSDFLEAWGRLLPEGRAVFGKEVDTITQHGEDGRPIVRFRDGTEVKADIVIGCDGIRSRVRQLLLGPANPASYARYTRKYCFRALLPMEAAHAVVGDVRTQSRFMYNGPRAHAITYPVAGGTLLNVLFVVTDPGNGGWPWERRHTTSGTREEVAVAFAGWHPAVCGLIDLLPETLDKWAIFDMHDNPASYYSAGAVALAGDAAHAAGPHLGSGAGFGVEDALVLAGILEAADHEARAGAAAVTGEKGRPGGHSSSSSGESNKVRICHDALDTYNAARFDRDQWLPGATREAVELFQWSDPEVGSDHEKLLSRISHLFHTIWDNDVEEMMRTAVEGFRKRGA